MNKEKILQLCDEIENTLSDAWNNDEIDYELAGHIVSFAKKIAAENTAPTIEAEPVWHGRWIVKWQEIYCSECNRESLYNPFGASKFSDFCPNCGARMDGGADNESE